MAVTLNKVAEYVDERIAQFEASARHYRKLAADHPTRSSKFVALAHDAEHSARALSHIKYFIEHEGEQHPDLTAVVTTQPVGEPRPLGEIKND